MSSTHLRKSERLGLSFPYDWSNPDIEDDTLIILVAERGFFVDLCTVCAQFGIDRVRSLAALINPAPPALERMLSNIEKGFAHAQV